MANASPRNATVHTVGGPDVPVTLSDLPDRCPICHTSIVPKILIGVRCEDKRVQEACFCTNSKCSRLFVATYERPDPKVNSYKFVKSEPARAERREFGDEISGVSAEFVKIYNQASAAEAAGLDRIAGMGLRKALEFLIKDFAVAAKPAEEGKIKSTPLSACINQYIDDNRLKEAAKRAAWLGNDETHYTRIWEDKDIRDMKILIQIALNAIENQLLAEKYAREMPEK